MKPQRIAILEFICGGGMAARPLDEIPTSLLREGRAMLHALAFDWSLLPNWDVLVSWDARLGDFDLPRVTVRSIDTRVNWMDTWRAMAKEVDYAIIIAPELDNQLIEVVDALRACGPRLLNADSEFLNAASDKWLTAQFLHRSNVAHPATWLLREAFDRRHDSDRSDHDSQAWMLKPRDGAGCHEVRRFPSIDELRAYVTNAFRSMAEWDRYIVQPWIDGMAGSMAVLCGPHEACVLPAMTQNIGIEDQDQGQDVRYLGGSGPWNDLSPSILDRFASQVIRALPGSPIGWIGIDFVVQSDAGDDNSMVAIEVNPRLTTSYLGIRQIVAENVAELLYRAALDHACQYSSSRRSVAFDVFGKATTVEVY